MKTINRKLGDAVNVLIMAMGIILILIGILIEMQEKYSTVIVSVGTSILATSLVSIITARYLLETDNIRKIISEWGLSALYETKAIEMNPVANSYLKDCKVKIDIICIGMSSFIASQGNIIKERLRSGTAMRIISCNPNLEYIKQRKKDESLTGNFEHTEVICEEVWNLSQWVEGIREEIAEAKIHIKYLNTYPAFSYLRLDDMVFFSANLYLKPSQQNMAIGYKKNGKGFTLLEEFYENLWRNRTLLTDEIERKS